MALSDAHLRYLFAISNAAAATPDVSSRQIASALGVTKPSVVHILNILMRDGMVVKRHYGKIYLTDRGAFKLLPPLAGYNPCRYAGISVPGQCR